MRVVLNLFAACLITVGVVWILQGYGIVPGSFVTGRMQWAHRGEIAAAAGLVLFGIGLMIPVK